MMTETLFEIGRFNKPLYQSQPENSSKYNSLVQSFCKTSYALYTEYFIKKITLAAQDNHPDLFKFSLKRNLRKCVKKFMLTDLEIVFLSYYCQSNDWTFDSHLFLTAHQSSLSLNNEEKQDKCLQIFLDLNAFFVKSYVGDEEQFQAIKSYLLEAFPKFNQIYQNWILSKPEHNFIISPRKISELYRKYTRNCQLQSNKKDYNELVSTIIDLSTTYSIIPNKKGQKRKKQQELDNQQNGEQIKEKTSKAHNYMQRPNNSEIFRIAQHSQFVDDEQLPKFAPLEEFGKTRNRRKSSLMFQSLHSLSRKSEQLAQSHIVAQKIEKVSQVMKKEQEKKPGTNKISLNFKKKQKPNETVLGFIGQNSEIKVDVVQKGKKEKVPNNREINMSFINLRSNRSSRSNSQLPFLWKPSQDNFFEKSKFG